METKVPLHISQVQQAHATFNKINILVFSISLLFLLYYRFSTLYDGEKHIFPWLLITMSEFLLSLFWIFAQAYRWRPVSRTVFPERLPSDDKLPPIDVFIFTCDPKREPTIGVMNTVVSAMCLDYPPEKLSVYLSDDGGAPITLYAFREAYNFTKKWIPFCRKYGIKTRAPEAYFSELNDKEHCHSSSTNFLENLKEMKSRYKVFKEGVANKIASDETCLASCRDHPPLVEVMHDDEMDELDKNKAELPLLVYVSREKRSMHHHNFKAGAINVLLRVSGMISNAPYLLVLDCDMYCNDPKSVRQAMCFHLDPQISRSLAFVQFPQIFHNVSKNDIYNVQFRTIFKVWYNGVDGLMGPYLSGTCFYLKRESLYRSYAHEDIDLFQARKRFGPSVEFIASLCGNKKLIAVDNEVASQKLLEKARLVASCTYEQDTQWGKQIGFRYQSVAEDFMTGMLLHNKGWISIYCNPPRPAFLGTGTTNLNDTLIQNTRWSSGLLQVGFSRFFPLTYRPTQMSVLQIMAYMIAFQPLNSFMTLCHSIIPQLCLLNGITLYPKVSDPWFAIFTIVYISSPLQQLLEVFSTGGSLKLYWNEQRIVFMKAATSNLLACSDIFMKWIGMKEIDFSPTNKSTKEEEIKRYEMDLYDFEIDPKFLLILTTIASLNITSFSVGILRAIINKTYNDLFGQIFLSLIVLVLSYPLIEGMLFQKGKGQIPAAVTLLSLSLVFIAYYIGALIL